jgi:hypothetical protein
MSPAHCFAVTKYVTDNDLRGGTTTVRQEDVSKLSGVRVTDAGVTSGANCLQGGSEPAGQRHAGTVHTPSILPCAMHHALSHTVTAIALCAWREGRACCCPQARIELAQCPCQNDTLLWSDFVTYKEPLSSNTTNTVSELDSEIVCSFVCEGFYISSHRLPRAGYTVNLVRSVP